jgi:hypothetical protein
MKRLSDTSPEAERVLIEANRCMTPARKWFLLGDLYRFARSLHASGLRLRNPHATAALIRDDWMAMHVGTVPDAIDWSEAEVMDQPIENRHVVHDVITALDSLGIAYALGGSLASSIYGLTRLTADADITVEPFPGKEEQLANCFGPQYYVSVDAIQRAIRDRSSFNIINTYVGFKVDVFIKKERPYEESLMRRRVSFHSPDLPDRPIKLVSPEDVLLLKLEWYRKGGEVSERQWLDVLGVLRTQAERLDMAYLDYWASDLGVSDLLELARAEAAS